MDEEFNMKTILRFNNVSKHYDNGVHALKNISFNVAEGEFISIIFLLSAHPVQENRHCSVPSIN